MDRLEVGEAMLDVHADERAERRIPRARHRRQIEPPGRRARRRQREAELLLAGLERLVQPRPLERLGRELADRVQELALLGAERVVLRERDRERAHRAALEGERHRAPRADPVQAPQRPRGAGTAPPARPRSRTTPARTCGSPRRSGRPPRAGASIRARADSGSCDPTIPRICTSSPIRIAATPDIGAQHRHDLLRHDRRDLRRGQRARQPRGEHVQLALSQARGLGVGARATLGLDEPAALERERRLPDHRAQQLAVLVAERALVGEREPDRADATARDDERDRRPGPERGIGRRDGLRIARHRGAVLEQHRPRRPDHVADGQPRRDRERAVWLEDVGLPGGRGGGELERVVVAQQPREPADGAERIAAGVHHDGRDLLPLDRARQRRRQGLEPARAVAGLLGVPDLPDVVVSQRARIYRPIPGRTPALLRQRAAAAAGSGDVRSRSLGRGRRGGYGSAARRCEVAGIAPGRPGVRSRGMW